MGNNSLFSIFLPVSRGTCRVNVQRLSEPSHDPTQVSILTEVSIGTDIDDNINREISVQCTLHIQWYHGVGN